MSAPLVAGTAALVQAAAGGTLTAKELRDIIVETADPLPSLQGKVISGGSLRADKAVQTAINNQKAAAPAPRASRKLLLLLPEAA